MKLKESLKKFDFIKRLKIPEKLWPTMVSNLNDVLKGSKNKYMTPLGKTYEPIMILLEWERVFKKNSHKLNAPLLEIENEQRAKFGPRSEQAPWIQRKPGLLASYDSQIANFDPPFYEFKDGKGDIAPITVAETLLKIRKNTNAGLPTLSKKGKVVEYTLENWDELRKREDPCMLFTRTAEMGKTRNVWGYPFVDIFYEMMWFAPFLDKMREKYWQASVVSPELVDIRLTEMILEAIRSDRILYSVDFDGFDASCSWQLIVKAFNYIKSHFSPIFGDKIDEICKRFYTIMIVTPTGILRGNHGVPSGSCFTNLIDSIIQAGVALTNDFIKECEMMINGDDGVYMMLRQNIKPFEDTWKAARLNLGKEKVRIATNWCTYCQRFYHIDYIKDGKIGGIYPVYRAINRLVWLEAFVTLKKKGQKTGISSRDHFGTRTLTILEQCKYHPMFEDLVRFVLAREKFALNITEGGLIAYAEKLRKGRALADALNPSFDPSITGIYDFESYKLIQKIIAEEGYSDVVDQEALLDDDSDYDFDEEQ